MPNLFPEAIKDSLQPDSLSWSFGQYEYLPTDNLGVLFADSLKRGFFHKTTAGIEGTLSAFSVNVGSVFFILLFSCFLVFSLIFYREGATLSGNFNTIFSFTKRKITGYKEQVTTAEIWGEFYMIFQAILILSIIFYNFLWAREFVYASFKDFAVNFSLIFFLLSILFGLKFLMYKSISSFFLSKDFKSWISRYFRLLELLGIILFIPAILYLYLPEIRNDMELIILIVIIMGKIVVIIELLNIFVKNKVGGFYFFVYLCGTEIAPPLIIYKGVILLTNIAGNYIV